MSVKMECPLKWNVQKRHFFWMASLTQIGMSLKLEWVSNLKVTKIGMSLKLVCNSNWNVTQIGMSHQLDFRSN